MVLIIRSKKGKIEFDRAIDLIKIIQLDHSDLMVVAVEDDKVKL
jgi:hypothetical protein